MSNIYARINISGKEVNVTPKQTGKRVSGEDCEWIVLGNPNLKRAVNNAIENGGAGFDALIDVSVKYVWYPYPVIQKNCYEVEGTAISTK